MGPERILWLSIGLLATGCGIAGVFLPLVPTTPFLLLAAFAFARSSPRLHDWLVNHPRLGPPIADWQAHGAISRPTKVIAAAVMIATWTLSFAAGVRSEILIVQALVLGGAAAFVLTRPDGPSSRD
jgi:uncharacterized membrane protein YbaN (DUF454 family)